MSSMTLELSKIDWGAISALSTIAIAVLGLLINSRLKNQDEQKVRYALLVEYRQELIAYSTRFFDLVAEGVALIDDVNASAERHSRASVICARLSSLVDAGRFIFPNYLDGINNFGHSKGPAFAGARRPALDAIMAAYFAVEASKQETVDVSKLRKAILELKRTGQPQSGEFDPNSAKSILIESRRAYLNCVVPDTFPREWTTMFKKLLGPVAQQQA